MARDGAEAIKRYREAMESGDPFDVVIMDLTISGGMGVVEAAAKLKEIDPGARVIVASGYVEDPVMSRYRGHGFNGMVCKPYLIRDLNEAIRQVLGNM